jgi:glycosyltransferase involved in cell wall biosynthesis
VSFLQVTIADDGVRQAGAAIRNLANLRALRAFADGQAIALRNVPKPPRRLRHPTAATFVDGEIERLLDLVGGRKPSFVLFEGVDLLRAMEAVRRTHPRLPLIVDFHNVESRLHADMRLARTAAFLRPLTRLRLAGRFRVARDADVTAARLADAVWTCSERDAAETAALGVERPIAVVPNPVPEWCGMAANASPPERGRNVLFVGHLGYAPNRRAATELARTIMPALRHRVPDARLDVCGRDPRRDLVTLLSAPGSRLTVAPAELGPHYREAVAAAMPLREGGGTRIKALEALAVGCPIVATAKAVEGLDLEPGHHFLHAETPQAFVSALARLYEDETLGQRLAQQGRALVAQRYGEAARNAAIAAALRTLRLV